MESHPQPRQRYKHRLLITLAALIPCLYFFLAGLAIMMKLGVENDEPLFAGAFLKPYGVEYTVRIWHSRVPLMLMTYIGTLKAWLYRPLMSIFGTGLLVLRLPMLLAGVASVWLFFRLLYRIAGLRAASIGCAVLAADAPYLLTVCFDWGPVALQHLLLLGGLLLLVRFYQSGAAGPLFWGFFLLGLGVWDKALAVWMLSGIAVAALVVFPVRILRLANGKRLAVALLGFSLGVYPLVLYNVKNHGATFAGNVRRDTSDLPGKARILVSTAKGGGLFGWMFSEDWQTPVPHAPRGILEQLSGRISTLDGHIRQSVFYYAFLLAVLLIPLARGDDLRAILFSLIAMAVAWVEMATNASTGGSVHHTILLWPFPQLVVAVSFAAASRRLGRAGIPAVAVATAVIVIFGALVGNEYFYVSYRFGPAPVWSDAILPLSDLMKNVHSGNVYCVDWGMLDPLRYLNHGQVPVLVGNDPISKPALSNDDREVVLHMITDPGAIFVAHTKDFENFPGSNENLIKFATVAGYRREMLARIPDSYGRQAFEVYRFVSTSSGSGE